MRHYAPPPRVHFVKERRIFPISAAHGHPRRWGASTVTSENRRIPGATPQRRHQRFFIGVVSPQPRTPAGPPAL